jgi:hypothetical protein
MQQPADVDRELLCFRTGKNHAIIEGVQKAAFPYPPFFFNQISVHDRNLGHGTSKAVKGHFDPDPESFSKGRQVPGHAFADVFFLYIPIIHRLFQSTSDFP